MLRFDQLLVALTVATVILCSLIGIFSDRLVLLLFGPNFSQSAFVLVIQVWTALFVAQGTVSTIWLLAEKATTIVFVRTFAGAVVSILLGLALIPQLGAAGAAIATLAAMASSSMIVLLFSGAIGREIFAHQLGALVLMPLWRAKYSGT